MTLNRRFSMHCLAVTASLLLPSLAQAHFVWLVPAETGTGPVQLVFGEAPEPCEPEMLKLIDNKTISGKIAKTVFEEMYATGNKPEEIVREKGLVQITDEGQLDEIITQIIADNPGPVEQYREGKTKTFGFFVGQVMKATKGKANPQLVNRLLKKKLEE